MATGAAPGRVLGVGMDGGAVEGDDAVRGRVTRATSGDCVAKRSESSRSLFLPWVILIRFVGSSVGVGGIGAGGDKA